MLVRHCMTGETVTGKNIPKEKKTDNKHISIYTMLNSYEILLISMPSNSERSSG